MSDRILQMIGLAKKAGKCYSGEYKVEDLVKRCEARLVIVAKDASEQTKKHYTDMCAYRDIPLCFYGTKEDIGKFTGKDQRAAACITDDGFAGKIAAMIREVKA